MRTTLTLEDDVDRLLRQVAAERKLGWKKVINEALRAGLAQLAASPPRDRTPYRTPPVSLGRPALPSLDDIAEALAIADGEDHA